ncbi:hypothetical protein [Streptomyces roseicoloratus]|uniref:Lipoprotein n=1 Tax=Streptomyces roseicoloratus TaxID=2508722 RepID=A0ABY9RY50_9ACTN|nr:hypothetical protein [Streptomyces roseicoloratus]WMX46658.1 hypothetical protein RGF97_20010 [Streptomyces roseicoloratus]
MSATVSATARRDRRPRRAALVAVLSAAVALGATACGSSAGDSGGDKPKATGPFGDMSAAQILDKAVATTKGARSLTVVLDGKTADGPMKGHLSTDVQGRCTGTMTVGAAGAADLIRPVEPTDKHVYLRFDEAALKEQSKDEPAEVQAEVVKAMKGRWLMSDADSPDARDMLDLCDLKKMTADFEQDSAGAVKGTETTIDGTKALSLTLDYKDGEKDTFYVATEGKPYLLRVVTTGGDEPGTVSFTGFEKPVTATAPAMKDVIDEKTLG